MCRCSLYLSSIVTWVTVLVLSMHCSLLTGSTSSLCIMNGDCLHGAVSGILSSSNSISMGRFHHLITPAVRILNGILNIPGVQILFSTDGSCMISFMIGCDSFCALSL
ncbi:unnamed protein product [Meganyctiphanes norvegica]|uniref:Secreted protein n=1 Tax=Meganyctiphanes norvegica TaxID=48144 RepID=A0AAV2RMQ9_MEGNR